MAYSIPRGAALLRGMGVASLVAALAVWPGVGIAAEPTFLTDDERGADFKSFCDFVGQTYAYFDQRATDWPRVCAQLAPQAITANRRADYVALLERALRELYDPHANLGTNTASSYRLVPSQTDLFARWEDGKAIIAAVREGSGAAAAGLRPGMEILSINGEPVGAAVQALRPAFLLRDDPAAHAWALQVALAARRDRPLTQISAQLNGQRRAFEFDPRRADAASVLSARAIGAVAYVRIHNTLGQQQLVPAFDQALAALWDQRALVIDLRDTPSGGNTTVARGLMSRLVDRLLPYQRHELVSEFQTYGIRRIWDEQVAPRGTPYLKPIVVLVGRWTGSMGEGLAIGLHATRGAPVLGQPMAGLLGANGEKRLPHSNIAVRVPAERLFHIDGTPRESVRPCAVGAALAAPEGQDAELDAALALALVLSEKGQTPSLPHCLGPR